MARPCSVCSHPDREAIDLALMAGAVIAHIAKDKGLTAPSLSRHRDRHIPRAMVKAGEIMDEMRADELVARVTEIFRAVQDALPAAKAKGDFKGLAALASQGLRACDLLMRYYGQLPTGTTINLIAMPEWQTVQTALLRALRPFPEATRAVTAELMVITDGTKSR